MKVYSLLISDRHSDPGVEVFRDVKVAEIKAVEFAESYWHDYESFRDVERGLFRLTCEDVGFIEVKKHVIV